MATSAIRPFLCRTDLHNQILFIPSVTAYVDRRSYVRINVTEDAQGRISLWAALETPSLSSWPFSQRPPSGSWCLAGCNAHITALNADLVGDLATLAEIARGAANRATAELQRHLATSQNRRFTMTWDPDAADSRCYVFAHVHNVNSDLCQELRGIIQAVRDDFEDDPTVRITPQRRRGPHPYHLRISSAEAAIVIADSNRPARPTPRF